MLIDETNIPIDLTIDQNSLGFLHRYSNTRITSAIQEIRYIHDRQYLSYQKIPLFAMSLEKSLKNEESEAKLRKSQQKAGNFFYSKVR